MFKKQLFPHFEVTVGLVCRYFTYVYLILLTCSCVFMIMSSLSINDYYIAAVFHSFRYSDTGPKKAFSPCTFKECIQWCFERIGKRTVGRIRHVFYTLHFKGCYWRTMGAFESTAQQTSHFIGYCINKLCGIQDWGELDFMTLSFLVLCSLFSVTRGVHLENRTKVLTCKNKHLRTLRELCANLHNRDSWM